MIRPAPTADSPVTLLRPWHPQLAGCASPLFGGIMTHPQLPPASGPGSSLAFQSLRVQAHLRIGNDSLAYLRVIFCPMYITYTGSSARTGQEKCIRSVIVRIFPCQVHSRASSGFSG